MSLIVMIIVLHQKSFFSCLCLQLEYFKQGKVQDFVQILETARTAANLDYPHHEKDQVCHFSFKTDQKV